VTRRCCSRQPTASRRGPRQGRDAEIGDPTGGGARPLRSATPRLRLLRTLPGRQFDVSLELRLRCSNGCARPASVRGVAAASPATRRRAVIGPRCGAPVGSVDQRPRRGAVVDRATASWCGPRRAGLVVVALQVRTDPTTTEIAVNRW
jgi:hypothetical protein